MRGRFDDEDEFRAPSAGVHLMLRRLRTPIIVLLLIFAVSVVALTIVPGEDPDGRPHRLSIFEAFYFMAYTASTIGYGELPHPFTPEQRMVVTGSIFLSVVGWAYAIGSLLSLMQDRAFRLALARRRFMRQVGHLAEPFLVLVGYGNATRQLASSLDEMGRRFVVVDHDEDRTAAVDLDGYRADTPTLLADARDTGNLVLAGLRHRRCEGIVALTGDDLTNLDVVMTAGLLRPGLPVIARTRSRAIGERMALFGAWHVVNPLDRFGNHLRILLRSPAAYQLMVWLTSAPGTPLPARREPLPRGRWVVSGAGRFSDELVADLEEEGVEVTLVLHDTLPEDVHDAVAFVAATEDDMTNLWLLENARRLNPGLFLVALQNHAANASLYRAAGIDFGMLPAELVVHEVLARLANPALMAFLPQVPRHDDAWADALVRLIRDRCGTGAPDLWQVTFDDASAPALAPWLSEGELRLGDVLRSPEHRPRPLAAVPLALLRDGEAEPAPPEERILRAGDVVLLAATPAARRALDATLTHPPTAAYVVAGRFVPSSWLWRQLSGTADVASRRSRES